MFLERTSRYFKIPPVPVPNFGFRILFQKALTSLKSPLKIGFSLHFRRYIPVIVLSSISFFGYLNLTQFEKQKLIINKSLKKNIDSISVKKVDSIINYKMKEKTIAPTNKNQQTQ
ncbi:hypothetical protein ACM39_00840 [Chryseobacterium sp. FH2]|nr:hypothetical protein ACM39_00840 [Chryseobacterium sp. FH2]